MIVAITLALRAIWWRKGASAVVFVVSVFATGVAAAGPLFLAGAGDSILQGVLADAPGTSAGTGLEVTKDATATSTSGPLESALATTMPPSVARAYPRTVISVERRTRVIAADGGSLGRVTIVHRDDACAHVRLLTGACPRDTAADEVMVSAVDARRLTWTTGQTILVDAFSDRRTPSDSGSRRMRITGIYQASEPDGTYWFNDSRGYFGGTDRRRDDAQGQPPAGRTLEAVFTGTAPFATFTASSANEVLVVADLTLDPHAVTSASTSQLRAGLDTFGAGLHAAGLNQGYYSAGLVTTDVRTVLDRADTALASMRTPISVVLLELVLLGLFVLFIVVAAAAEARTGEVALAKLRGLPAASTFSFGLLETLLLLAAATPTGAMVALASLNAVAPALFGTGLTLHVSASMWTASAVTGAGGAVAAVGASLRSLRQPVVQQLRRTSGLQARGVLALEAVSVVLAVATVWRQWGGDGRRAADAGAPDPLALLTPGLFAFAVALVAARAVPLLAGLLGRSTRGSRHVGLFIGARELSRRPGGTRLFVVLTTVFALSTFSVLGAEVFAANRADRAATEVGASRVVLVDPYSPVDLRAVVHRLDPSGRQAMSVAQLPTSVFGVTSADRQDASGPSREPFPLLVADVPRATATAFWRRDFAASTLAQLSADLAGPFPQSPSWQGRRLRLTVTAHLPCCGPVRLTLTGTDGQGRSVRFDLGRLVAGQQALVVPTPDCMAGPCAIRRLELARDDAGTYTAIGDVTIGEVAADVSAVPPAPTRTAPVAADPASWQPVAGATDPARWQSLTAADAAASVLAGAAPPSGDPPDQVAGTGPLRVSFAAPSQVRTFGAVARVPTVVPAVVTAGLRAPSGADGYLVALPTGAPLPIRVTAVANVLPGAAAMLLPWDAVASARAWRDEQVVPNQVWLSDAAPADFPVRLAAAGVRVTGVQTPADRERSLARQGPSLAALFLLAGACAAAALAVGAAVVNLYLVARRRSFELAALRALGFRTRTVTAAALAEQVLVAAIAVVTGVAVGVVGARFGLPSIPEYADGATVPPMLVRIDPLLVLAVAGVIVTALGTGIGAGVAAILASAGPGRLREGQA